MDFKVELKQDGVESPSLYDDYSEADIAAFSGGAWQFVIVRLVPVDRDLTDLVHAEKYMRGVDWGELPQGRIDREDLTDAQVRDLALSSVRTLRAFGFTVDAERDSEFAVGRTLAPF